MSPRLSKRRRLSTDSASKPPSSASSFSSFTSLNSGPQQLALRHHITPGRVAWTSPSRRTTHGTINQGPALRLRGPGNTFWHLPMLPQPQSNTESFWHPPLAPPTKINNTPRKNYSPARDDFLESSISSVRSCSKPLGSKTEDSTMDFLHVMQDDELFFICLHPHDEKTISNVETGHAMYVGSFVQ